jgi:ABC-2 type transport system ATP-binding protein
LQHYRRLADRLELDLSRRVASMSTGMRQKLALSVTMAANTPLMILDEPTANLDPTVRAEVVAIVLEARQAGRTVIFSSHVLSEVEEACDRVLILREGRLAESIRMTDVREQHRIHAALRGSLSPLPADLAGETRVENGPDGGVTIHASGDLARLLGWLAEQPLTRLHIEPVGLRTIYERHHGATSL